MFVDGVETKFEEGLTILVRVRTRNVGGPVSDRLRIVAPDASLFTSTRRVDVVASGQLAQRTKQELRPF